MSTRIGKTILDQLGGNKFTAMTGAKDFYTNGNSLNFRIPRSNTITHVRITLDPTDTYTMLFMKVYRRDVTNVAEHSGLFADQLQPVFTKETGLRTHL